MLKVIGIGDNVCDKYEHLGMMYPGGQALNFSVYAKMLGADAAYMGVFGSDRVADHVIKTLDEFGVDRSRCRQHNGENGYACVTLVDGDRVFLGSNKGGIVNEHPIELNQEDMEYIKGFQLIHTSNNGHFDTQLPVIKTAGVPISYDFSNHWNQKKLVERVAPHITYAFLSCGSAPKEETESVCREFYSYGCQMVTATRGSRGALIYDGKNFYEQPPKLVVAVDTLGAGDSFATAFLLSWTESRENLGEALYKDGALYEDELKKAMRAGAEFASKTCMERGAFGYGIPFEVE